MEVLPKHKCGIWNSYIKMENGLWNTEFLFHSKNGIWNMECLFQNKTENLILNIECLWNMEYGMPPE